MSVVYWIHSNNQTDITSQGYIGITNNFDNRMFSHKSVSSKIDYPLYKAINKYGWDNLIKEVLLIGDDLYCKFIEKKLRPNKRIGWNIAIGGDVPPSMKGCKQTKLHIENRSNALKGRISGFVNKKHSDSAKEKCRLANVGKVLKKETKNKISIANSQAIKINDVIYDSWLNASKILGIPMGSFNYILKQQKPMNGKYSWVNNCELVI